jgi:hypothetical protein
VIALATGISPNELLEMDYWMYKALKGALEERHKNSERGNKVRRR